MRPMAEQGELTGLAATGELDTLEERWLAAFSNLPGSAAELSELLQDAAAAIALIAEHGENERAQSMIQVVPGDVEADASPEARLAMVQQLARHDPGDAALRRRLRDAYRARYKRRRGLDRLLEMAGLYDESISPTDVNDELERFMSYDVDRIVRHPSWGAGKITKIDRFTAELVIDFETRKRHRMSPDAAVETLDLLDNDDFDARGLVDAEGLQELVDSTPLEALKLLIRSMGGTANLNAVKDKLLGTWIDDGKWSSWWNRAKKAAFSDPFVEINEDVKPHRLSLREEAKSPADEAVEAIEGAHTFKDRWDIAKRYFKHETEGADRIWDALAEDLEKPMAERDLDDLVPLTEARRERQLPLDPLIELEVLPELMARLPMSAQRELAEATMGVREDWPAVLGALYEGDSCKIRGWVREQLAEDDPARLADIDRKLVHDPMRDPDGYVQLASRVLAEKWASSAAINDPFEVVIDLMQLASQVANRKLQGKLGDLPHEIAELLLSNDAKLVRQLVQDAPEPRVIRAARLMSKTTALGPVLVQVGPAIEDRVPNLELGSQLPFWKEVELLATQSSIEERRKFLRSLMEEEIPKVEKAIGAAQAFGDLSENSEWTAAIERRNQLVDQIERVKREITAAQPIENQPIDERVVCPGTRVKIKRTDDGSGTELELTILGPWDSDVDAGVVSYRSPMGEGLLGLEPGQRGWVELPEGREEYEVLSIVKAVGA